MATRKTLEESKSTDQVSDGTRPSSFSATMRGTSTSSKRRGAAKPFKPRFMLSKAQIDDLFEAFSLFDNDAKGWILMSDLRVAFRALGFEPTKEEMRKFADMINYEKTHRIGFDQFVDIMTIKMTDSDSLDDLIKAFKLFDIDGTGAITFKKLKIIATKLGEDVNDEALHEMIRYADLNQDERVNMEEFLQALTVMKLGEDDPLAP